MTCMTCLESTVFTCILSYLETKLFHHFFPSFSNLCRGRVLLANFKNETSTMAGCWRHWRIWSWKAWLWQLPGAVWWLSFTSFKLLLWLFMAVYGCLLMFHGYHLFRDIRCYWLVISYHWCHPLSLLKFVQNLALRPFLALTKGVGDTEGLLWRPHSKMRVRSLVDVTSCRTK